MLSGNVENVLGSAALQHFIEGVELLWLRQLRDISRMNEERRRRWHSVDAIEGNLESLRHILVRLFTESDVAVADLQKAEVGSRQRLSGPRNLGESFRREDAAADRPKQAGTSPCHTVEKAAAINPVVFVVVRNVIGHNIWFCLGWFG